MRTVKINPDEAIASYKAAFEQANGRQPPFDLVYERGWFRFQEGDGAVISRCRRRWLKVMTNSLLRCVPAPSLSAGGKD